MSNTSDFSKYSGVQQLIVRVNAQLIVVHIKTGVRVKHN